MQRATIDLLATGTAVDLNDIERLGNEFRAISDDPQLLLKPATPLRPGWYTVSCRIEGQTVRNPKVYFDSGSGFHEGQAVTLERVRTTATYRAVFHLAAPALLVRFDPSDSASRFAVKSLPFRRMSRLDTGLYLANHALKIARADPARLAARWPQYLRFLANPHFIHVRAPDARHGAGYQAWIAKHDFDAARDGDALAARVATLENPPLISVIMPVYNTPVRLLDAAIRSVRRQIYANWELCIADDCSPDPRVRRRLAAWESRDPRIKVVYREQNGHISEATNSAFAIASGEWIAMFDHDDILRENALAEVALEIAAHPRAQLIYSDEDKIDARGRRRFDAYFKPDFSRELFRSQNYLNHLTVHRAENIRAVGGWRKGFEGSQDYDLNLRIFERIDQAAIRHIPKVLYHWRAVAGSTAAAGSEKSYAYEAGLRALQEHVERTGLKAKAEPAPGTPFYRIHLDAPDPEPLVSLIIPTRDRVDLLSRAVGSILEKTTWKNYEIIVVDNKSEQPETLDYFREIAKRPNVRVLKYGKPFNFSAINNFAVSKAKGDVVGLVNNDIEVISPDWLTEMVSWAMQPDIGCVGAKLYYENDTIQHAGRDPGDWRGSRSRPLRLLKRDAQGYFDAP